MYHNCPSTMYIYVPGCSHNIHRLTPCVQIYPSSRHSFTIGILHAVYENTNTQRYEKSPFALLHSSCTLSTLVPRPACIITRLPHTRNCENCPYSQRHTRISSTTPALPSSLSAPQFPMPYEVIKPRTGPTTTGRPDARGIRPGRQRMIKLTIRFLWTHWLCD